MWDDSLKDVSVIGAAGKMGSGITLLLLQEMAHAEALQRGSVGGGEYKLHAIDANAQGLDSLKFYLRKQLLKAAEKNINALRGYYAKNRALVSNEEIIQDFVQGAMDILHLSADLPQAVHSRLVFEAILEDVEVKRQLFSQLVKICPQQTLFFTNTSSIPISLLAAQSQLEGRLIGFHFYNPPPIQKLVEVILPDNALPTFKPLVVELGKKLGKTLVFSKDVAGFIGNGHFIREMAYACEKVRELTQRGPMFESIYLLNTVTQDYLIRPMGIFQLIDYVGIDVVASIAKVMSTYIVGGVFEDPLISRMLQAGVSGGQYPDGSQKDGFFKYEKGLPVAIYSLADSHYHFFKDHSAKESAWLASCSAQLGALPFSHMPWKKIAQDGDREAKLKIYFHDLFKHPSFGADLAKSYLVESRDIAHGLVHEGIAKNIEDVDTVLKQGFFHLYSPDAPFMQD